MAQSAVSRRLSEVTGVALFAASLLWLVALVSYSPADPAWFFNSIGGQTANFAGPAGAFLSELAFQLLGYTAYLIPFLMGYLAWHYFWCEKIDAGYTKMAGATLFVIALAGLFEVAFGVFDPARHAGGWIGSVAATMLSFYFGRTGATICLLTLTALSVILTTQFSFGRAATAIGKRVRVERGLMTRIAEWREAFAGEGEGGDDAGHWSVLG